MINQIKKIITLAIALCLFTPIVASEPMEKPRLKVGLVLGGGGAKGAAEIGALKVIEESGIPIDYIAGTSIGSIVGGLYAMGYRSEQLDSLFNNQEWLSLLADRNRKFRDKPYMTENGVTYIFGFPVSRKKSKLANKEFGAFRGDNIIGKLDSLIGTRDSLNFDSLPIPFRCVATDIKHLKEVDISKGRLSEAMRASMAIPGAFKPIRKDSLLLTDGGMTNNLPVDVVRRMGADVVIAIDLTQNKPDDEEAPNAEVGDARGLFGWLMKRPDLQKYRENVKNIDVYINPNLEGYDVFSFSPEAVKDMIAKGEKAGRKQLKKLLKLKDNLQKSR
jgi:NTE family protein